MLSNQMMIEEFRAYAHSQGDYDVHFDSFCFETESYPIEGLHNINA